MHRRGFLQAMLLFIAAALAGWRPKPALAKPPTPQVPECRPPLPGELSAMSNAIEAPIGTAPILRIHSGEPPPSQGGHVHIMAMYSQEQPAMVQPVASLRPRFVAYDQSGNGRHAFETVTWMRLSCATCDHEWIHRSGDLVTGCTKCEAMAATSPRQPE